MHYTGKTRGFTIVELLIVIVVISVLAAVTVTAYGGIQARATNSQTLSVVTNWEKILKMYKVIKGSLPLSDYNCLANASTDFPVSTGLASGECMHGHPALASFSAVYSDALTTDLKSILSTTVTLPSGYMKPISGTINSVAVNVQGVRYNNLAIEYYLLGGATNCGKGAIPFGTAADTLTFCTLSIN